MVDRPRRSALYMPASNARAIDKARGLACDVVILDLEDAVAPEMKVAAREQALAAVRDGGFGNRELVLRINGLDTAWGADDCRAALGGGFDAVLLPKVSQVADLGVARGALGDDGPPMWAMIENCAGVPALAQIAAAAATCRLECLVVGTNDLALDMRCMPDAARTPLLGHLAMIVTAARAVGIAALDGVCNVLEDGDVLAAECAQGAMFGFDGKTLIHPAQIAAANRAFAPTPAALANAERIVAAFAAAENADKGAIRIDGQMVERLHLAAAQRLIGG